MKGRHVQAGLLFIAVCLVIGLALALFSASKEADVSATDAISNDTAITNTIAAVPAPPATVAASEPDFLVTDELRNAKPAWGDLGVGPNATVFCAGAKARLTNGSSRPLNLNVVVAESDNSSALGSVQPGQTMTFDPGEEGAWNIVDAADGGPLFHYEVEQCGAAKRAAAEDQTAAADDQAPLERTGRCKLTVEGSSIIDGACYYATTAGGSFVIADKADRSGYVARAQVNGTAAQGFWNAEPGNAADTDLGQLERRGACWHNAASELCLWGS